MAADLFRNLFSLRKLNIFLCRYVTHITSIRLAMILLPVIIFTATIRFSFVHTILEQNIARTISFRIRSYLQLDPVTDPRIKVFVFDDPTVSDVGALDIDLLDWARVFQALDKSRPRQIIVDKLFYMPTGRNNSAEFVELMQKLRTNISIALFLNPNEIVNRDRFKFELGQYNFKSWERSRSGSLRELSNWFKPGALHVYGADRTIQPAFRYFGHIVYEGKGLIKPLVRTGNELVIPHLGLFLDQDLEKFVNGSLYINKHRVPTDLNGNIQINLAKEEVYKKNYSMKALIDRARQGKNIPVVSEGDIVIILPAMYTGNTDFTQTPSGYMPGGYLNVAMVNSVLTGNWLYEVNDRGYLTLAAMIVGLALGSTLWAPRFWLLLFGITILVPVGSIAAFVFFGIIVSWIWPVSTLIIAATSVFAERSRSAKLEQVRIEKELETARLVQTTFFPKDGYSDQNISIEGHYIPASECSGDWWGHFTTNDGVRYIMVGDALGHGVGAALMTGFAYSTCMTISDFIASGGFSECRPAALLSRINRIFYEAVRGESSMTFFVAAFDLERGTITFANAGHVLPILVPFNPNDLRIGTQSTKFKKYGRYPISLKSAGNPLGSAPLSIYNETVIQLEPGDKVFFYTDALVECEGKNGRPWGRKKLLDEVVKNADKTAAGMRDGVIASAVTDFGTGPLNDDLTIVVVDISQSWQPKKSKSA